MDNIINTIFTSSITIIILSVIYIIYKYFNHKLLTSSCCKKYEVSMSLDIDDTRSEILLI